ncbi:hypothetical protein N7466_003541 [Penicillium verhagenii]|uniref:uncharacterized protein n=1 Tax=Penicillium verhagenii TaxID=1562060 RepID=UPI002545A632|nr:uncharacterized protein N7466_003541 [Penicillium verhagenii]KAJ5937091.1 hypothetical protein N7466_003541 [Penicillium verhagenii]
MADVYALNLRRNEDESHRLDEQFDLLTENIGYLIHPVIHQSFPADEPLKIADLATGTGRFLLRLAETKLLDDNAILHGSDISSSLFPPPTALPQNMKFNILDIREPIPDHLHCTYDFVHVRQVAAGLTSEDWIDTVINVAKLLKPGGAMQWEECDFTSVVHLRGAGVTGTAARKLGKMFKSGMWEYFRHGWNRLEEGMTAAGLQDVASEMVSSDRVPETREALTRNGIRAIVAWANDKAQAGILKDEHGQVISLAELQTIEEQAYKDIDSGCYVRFDIHAAWGIRPKLE